MDLRVLVTVFATIFAAELGDKTQLGTILYATSTDSSKWTVFFGSSLALVMSSALAVFAGALIGSWINPKMLARIAGLGFVAVGIWTLVRA